MRPNSAQSERSDGPMKVVSPVRAWIAVSNAVLSE
jgi:hypothetical protein